MYYYTSHGHSYAQFSFTSLCHTAEHKTAQALMHLSPCSSSFDSLSTNQYYVISYDTQCMHVIYSCHYKFLYKFGLGFEIGPNLCMT